VEGRMQRCGERGQKDCRHDGLSDCVEEGEDAVRMGKEKIGGRQDLARPQVKGNHHAVGEEETEFWSKNKRGLGDKGNLTFRSFEKRVIKCESRSNIILIIEERIPYSLYVKRKEKKEKLLAKKEEQNAESKGGIKRQPHIEGWHI